MKKNNWLEIDKDGLKALQDGKSKTFIVRELVQNAWDENTKQCDLYFEYSNRTAYIKIVDDSPDGFRDLRDAYTLFKHTSKRSDSSKRGRFNFGEKQVLCLADEASIITTKGSVFFSPELGRYTGRKKTQYGSVIDFKIKMTKSEFEECIEYCKVLYVPSHIIMTIFLNGEKYYELKYEESFKTFECSLPTEIEIDGVFRQSKRNTRVNVYKSSREDKFLYEMGLPVCTIDCDYDIDVQQKIPLATDRESVTPSYFKKIYGEVLNNTFEDIHEDNSSNLWVRTAITSENVNKDAALDIFKKRFGDKAVSANPFDPNSIDRAISAGYNVIHGSEMYSEEWSKFKSFGAVTSSSEAFGSFVVGIDTIIPENKLTDIQKRIAQFTIRVAKHFLNIDIKVEFLKSKASTLADYGGRKVRFNVTKLNSSYWDLDKGSVSQPMLSLIIHEIAHEKGTHYETKYHETISSISSKMVYIMRDNPEWFKI